MKWLLTLLLVCTNAHADSWLNFGGISKHSKPGFNEANVGFGFETNVAPNLTVGAGQYLNSLGEVSQYIGAETTVRKLGKGITVSLAASVVDGYPSGAQVVFAPTLVLDWGYVGLRLFGMPEYKGSPALMAAQFRVRVK